MTTVTTADLAAWLRRRLGRERTPTLFRPGGEAVGTLALALEPADLPPDLAADAVFLHRAYRLGDAFPGAAVLASHDGFDARLTTGVNRPLAARLGWRDARPFAWEGRPVGMLATPPQRDWEALVAALAAEFGGFDELLPPASPTVDRVALMSAMRPELVSGVAALGATAYLTGQLRPGAVPRARELGVGVAALGHRRTEEWGLRQLARELGTAFPGLVCRVYPSPSG